jgi:carboxypeptidase Q
MTGYDDAVPKIPSACISVEEAQMLRRMQDRGNNIRIHMKLTCHFEAPATSRNTIFEITGSERPHEIVLLSGHFDSWDVGQGAMDDGGGCAVMWSAMMAIKLLGINVCVIYGFIF